MMFDSRLPERFWVKVQPEPMTGCWLWLACVDKDGYGIFGLGGVNRRAHRVSYEALIGPISAGLHIDHVRARGCLGSSCVNPDHMEPVTPGVNNARGGSPTSINARKTHCPDGHLYAETAWVDKRGYRYCRECQRAMWARRNAIRAAKRSTP